MYRCSANNATTIMRRMKSICGKSHADAETSRSRKFHTGKGETRIREETGCDSERERYTKIWRNKEEEEGANWPYTPTETRTCVCASLPRGKVHRRNLLLLLLFRVVALLVFDRPPPVFVDVILVYR